MAPKCSPTEQLSLSHLSGKKKNVYFYHTDSWTPLQDWGVIQENRYFWKSSQRVLMSSQLEELWFHARTRQIKSSLNKGPNLGPVWWLFLHEASSSCLGHSGSYWSQMTEKPQRRSINPGTFHVPLSILSFSDPQPSLPSPALDTVGLLYSTLHFGIHPDLCPPFTHTKPPKFLPRMWWSSVKKNNNIIKPM